jgi:hypothetical protein
MKMEEIEICETKEELNAYTKSEEYLTWPDAP